MHKPVKPSASHSAKTKPGTLKAIRKLFINSVFLNHKAEMTTTKKHTIIPQQFFKMKPRNGQRKQTQINMQANTQTKATNPNRKQAHTNTQRINTYIKQSINHSISQSTRHTKTLSKKHANTHKQTTKQASKQASRQTNKQAKAHKQANTQPNKHAQTRKSNTVCV